MNCCISTLVLLPLLMLSFCGGQEPEPLEVRVAKARELVNLAQSKFDTAKRLFEANSMSRRGYRKAQYALDKSTVELAILVDPGSKEENLLLLANITLRNSAANRKMFERLRATQAASEYEVERAIFQEDIARLRVKYYQSQNDIRTMHFLAFKIAVKKAKYVNAEFERMEPLYKRGSYSKARYDELTALVKVSQAELEQAREAMGATAKVIVK